MIFRNLSLYRFDTHAAADLARLPEVLPLHPLQPCGALELASTGFVPPIDRGEDRVYTHAVKQFTAFAVGTETRMLPAQVVNRELKRKVREIAAKEGRAVGPRERKRLREDVFTQLLPRAFVRSASLHGYVDTEAGWLVLDTASHKAAEEAIDQLRHALGTFPAVPLAPKEGPRVLMTDWLTNGNLPAGLTLGEDVELRDPATAAGAIARCRRQDLDAEEVKEHLRNGKQVFQLGLVFENRISFVLGEDLTIRKLHFADSVTEYLADSYEDAAAEAEATFMLMWLEVERLLVALAGWFGIDRPAGAW